MKIELKQKAFKAFRGYVGLLNVINEEATFLVSKEKISVLMMDPSHVAMIDASIKAEAFDSYEAEDGEKVSINIKELLRFLDRVDEKKDRVQIRNTRAKMIMTLKRHGSERRFEIPLLDSYDGDELPKPKIDFKVKVKLTGDALASAVKDVAIINHLITIKGDAHGFHISGEGDMGSSFSDWESGSEDILELEVKEDGGSIYTMSYIQPIINQCKAIGDSIVLELSESMPVKISAVPKNTDLEAIFYLAPCL